MPLIAVDGTKKRVPICIHDSSCAKVDLKICKSEGTYPWNLCLVNPINDGKYSLHFGCAYKVSAVIEVAKIASLKLSTMAKVSEAHYIKAFTVRMGRKFEKNISKVKASFKIDGDKVMDPVFLKDLKAQETVLLEKDWKKTCLFQAKQEGQWVGYMLPNGSAINFDLSDLPEKFSPFKITVEFDLVSYVI